MRTRLTLNMAAFSNNKDNGELIQCITSGAAGSLERICDVLCEEAANGFDKQSRLTRDEKQICKKRFSEVFKQMFMSNVCVEQPGLQITENENEDSSEVNLENKKSISEALPLQFDDAILKTARKRKEVPKLCVRNLKTHTKLELGYLNSVQIQIPSKPATPVPPVFFDSPEESERLSKSLKLLSSLSKKTAEDCGRLENLDMVKTIAAEVEKSKTHQLIFKTDDSQVPFERSPPVNQFLQDQPAQRQLSPCFK